MRLPTICIVAALVAGVAGQSMSDLNCQYTLPAITQSWIRMTDPCISKVRSLIDKKMNNAIQYLAVANYYLQDSVNRPGYANMFIDSAYQDRSDAIELYDYLLMRGQNVQGRLAKVDLNFIPPVVQWNTLVEACEFVLNLEATTTNLLLDVVSTCENQTFDDYHVTNYFSRTFLQRQYDDQKWLADVTSSLRKLLQDHKSLGEFLSDIQLHMRYVEGANDDDDDDDDDEDDS